MKSLGLLLTVILFASGIHAESVDDCDNRSSIVGSYTYESNDTILKTSNLILVKLSEHVYQHISFLNTTSWGKVNCNGMLAVNNAEAVILDTPANIDASEELIQFVQQNLKSKIVALVPTHFHEDCIGGLKAFDAHAIPVYTSTKTLSLLKANAVAATKSTHSYTDSLTLKIGEKDFFVRYFGEGHTKDNVVGYFPTDGILFGGCLIKELGASKGNLEDANTKAWSATVSKVKSVYPQAKLVIPGHGNAGGIEILDYTIKLFK